MATEYNKKLVAFLIKSADTLVCKVGQEFLSDLEIYYVRRQENHCFNLGLFSERYSICLKI